MKILKMKLLMPVCFLFSSYLYSQYFDGGIFVGFTASQIDGDNYAGYHQPGLTGGLYTSRQFKMNIRGIMELKYAAKGARETGNNDEPMLYEQKLRYIEVPVKINYQITKYNLDIELGINSSYLFNEKIVYDSYEYNSDDPNNKIELSWMVGVNYNINEYLFASVQFNYSLLPITRYENTDYRYGPIARKIGLDKGDYNNVIQFVMYYQISRK